MMTLHDIECVLVTCRKKLFSAVHNFVHLNLAIALFVGYLVFTVGVELATKNEVNGTLLILLLFYYNTNVWQNDHSNPYNSIIIPYNPIYKLCVDWL